MQLKKIILTTLIILLTSSAYSAEKLVVLLDWFANPDHAPLIVAKQQGYFAAQGLDVELIGPADPSDPPKLVAAGKADIAISYQPQLIIQIDQGLPLIQIGTLINKPLNCLVTLKSSPIKTLADLKGKNIGCSNSGMNNAMLKVMLAKYLPKNANVRTTNIHYNLTQALLSGKVDAVTGMMRNFEVPQLELAGSPARVFYPENHGMPTYSELIFIAKKDHENDPRFLKFLTAVKQGTVYLKKHPEESWQIFAKLYPESNDDLNHRAWFTTIAYFADNPTDFDSKKFMLFAEFMQQNHLIKQVQPLKNYAVT